DVFLWFYFNDRRSLTTNQEYGLEQSDRRRLRESACYLEQKRHRAHSQCVGQKSPQVAPSVNPIHKLCWNNRSLSISHLVRQRNMWYWAYNSQRGCLPHAASKAQTQEP